MKRALKVFKQILVGVLCVAPIAFVVTLSVINEMETVVVPPPEAYELDNISRSLPSNERRAIDLSRRSSVQILSHQEESGGTALSSGTYVTVYDRYFILTTQHGIVGSCEHTIIMVADTSHDCVQFIEVNEREDYAIIEVVEIEDRAPVDVKKDIPEEEEWIEALSIHKKIFYTGFPNSMGPLTFDGKIVGHSKSHYIYLHSYAWPGSSGSGVFTEDGQLIGHVMAVDVGFTGLGAQIIEDFVILVPAFNVNWDSILEIAPIEAN